MTQTTSWDPESYAKSARFVSELGEPLLQLLEPAPGEFILDLGCGDGVLTQKIAGYGCKVIGADSSFLQLQAAKKRGLNAVVVDGHSLAFKPRFDAVFTNAALHWMKQPEKVTAGVANSLKPRGHFVGEFGGKGNVETIRSALHAGLRKYGIDPIPVDPWYYPSPEEYSELLSSTGFTVDHIELLPRPTKLPGDLLGWLEVFAQPFTKSVPEIQREDFLADVRDGLATILKDRDGNWVADYVRLRFKAFKASRD
jgi:trans-aconitate methyltransferase